MSSERHWRRRLPALLIAVAFAFVAGCGGGGDSGSGGGGEGGDDMKITIGVIPSWTDSLATAYLQKNQLEAAGYEVEIQELSEAAPLYAGVAGGDIDVYSSAWPDVTHKAYMDEYGDQLEDLATYNDNATNTIAVPDYVDIKSMEELADNADMFDGKIIGIEPGAGLTRMTKESVIPKYGLEGKFTLVESSTPAMLAELQSAIDKKEPIVVTLWRPFWANQKFPVRDLEDPLKAFGEGETMHVLATKGFSEEHPQAGTMLKTFKLTDEQFGDLEDKVVNEFGEGKEAEAVDAWLEANPDWSMNAS